MVPNPGQKMVSFWPGFLIKGSYAGENMAESIPEKVIDKLEPRKIRIVITDDHPLLRQALRNVLEKQNDFDVIAEAGDGEEAIKLTTELLPDVVIMDVSMPKLNGIEATRRIKSECPSIAILALSVHSDNEHIARILQAGAAGYLTKSVYGEEVINAIRALASGETVLAPSISQQIFKYAFQNMGIPTILDSCNTLTAREIETLSLVAKGLSNKEIALRLNLSMRTVKSYMADLFLKLNVASRTEAVMAGLKKGLIALTDLE